jgi:hypothetical protein
MANSIKAKIHYLLLPARINVQESVEELALPEGKTADDVLAGLFNVRSIKVDEGRYSAIEVVAAELLLDDLLPAEPEEKKEESK